MTPEAERLFAAGMIVLSIAVFVLCTTVTALRSRKAGS